MKKHYPYNNIIEGKLKQLLPLPDEDHLWNDMHSILDKKLPQKKERRRFILWFLSAGCILLLILGSFIIAERSLFSLSMNESPVATNKKLPGASQSNKLINDEVVINSREGKENVATGREGKEKIMIASETNQKNKNNISSTATSTTSFDDVINKSFITEQTIKQSKDWTTNEQFNLPVVDIFKARENFDIASVNLKSNHQDPFIATNQNEEKNSLRQQPESTNKKFKRTDRNNKERGYYTGIISGVDMSSIHFHSAKPGATMGFILGYAFNNKWSVESGLLWDAKKIYDNGRYFNPPGYTPTNGITITAVNGKSRLYEWPVNMKYTIIPGKHSLFATAGLSSYFMRLENYDYEYKQNNQPGGHNYLSYKNETRNWFSVVNFSLGYSHKISDVGSLRIEPYLKLPITNLGIGNMPIMSTGLNIGYIKTLR